MIPCVTAAPLNINVFAGFTQDVSSWMTATANEKKVPESGRQGGIIFDEMSIQRDLQLDSVKMGKEGNDLDRYRGVHEKNGKVNNTTLASNVLQMECLGFSGFVFPFAQFATSEFKHTIWCACSGRPVVTCTILVFMFIFACSMGPAPTGHS